MPSITTWQRLEPRTRTTTLSSLRARWADPEWALWRQRALGELHGSDSASAVRIDLTGRRSTLTRYRSAAAPSTTKPTPLAASVPLETMVEAETGSAPATAGSLFAAQAGQCFLRALGPERAARYRATYLQRYPLNRPAADVLALLDDAALRMLDMLVGRAPDGHLLWAELAPAARPATGPPSLPAQPAITAGDTDAVLTAAEHWLDWYESVRPPQRTEAWLPTRLEHEFRVAGPRPVETGTAEICLRAPEYPGGQLDWHSFDVDPSPA